MPGEPFGPWSSRKREELRGNRNKEHVPQQRGWLEVEMWQEKGNLQGVTISPGGPALPRSPASPLLPGWPWKAPGS